MTVCETIFYTGAFYIGFNTVCIVYNLGIIYIEYYKLKKNNK